MEKYILLICILFGLCSLEASGGDAPRVPGQQVDASWGSWLSNNKLLIAGGTATLAGGVVLAHTKWPWFNKTISSPLKSQIEKLGSNLKKGDPKTYILLGTAGLNAAWAYFMFHSYRHVRWFEKQLVEGWPEHTSALAQFKYESEMRFLNHVSVGTSIGGALISSAIAGHVFWPWFNKNASTPCKEFLGSWFTNLKNGDTSTLFYTCLAEICFIGATGILYRKLSVDPLLRKLLQLTRQTIERIQAQIEVLDNNNNHLLLPVLPPQPLLPVAPGPFQPEAPE